MSPARKDPILNQDKNTLGIRKDQSLPPHVPKFPPGFKSLRNQADDDHHESTDTPCTDKDDMSRNNSDDSIENVKATKNTNDDDEYKEDNFNIKTVKKVLYKKPKKKKHLLNG